MFVDDVAILGLCVEEIQIVKQQNKVLRKFSMNINKENAKVIAKKRVQIEGTEIEQVIVF